MKKSTVAFLALVLGMVLLVGTALAVEIKTDGSYTWEQNVVAKGLKYGTPEFETAKAECIEFEVRVKRAQNLNAEGMYLEASEVHPYSWCRAWYLLNHLREQMGGTKDETGTWSGYKVKDAEHRTELLTIASKVQEYVEAARSSGIDGKGDLSVDKVEEYLQKYRSGILKQ